MLQELLDEYSEIVEKRKVTSSKDQARLEAQIWSLIPKIDRPKTGIGEFFGAKFNVSRQNVRDRFFIYAASSAADLLWNEIDAGMVLHSAALLLKKARFRIKTVGSNENKASLEEAIFDVLNECKQLPKIHMADGKVTYRRKATFKNKDPQSVTSPQSQSRVLWDKMRDAIKPILNDYVRFRFPDADEAHQERFVHDFESDLNILIYDFQNRVQNSRSRNGNVSLRSINDHISRSKMNSACLLLGIDPPRGSDLIDLKLARQKQRILAREYHPDAHGGDESLRSKFEAVNEAYRILEQYNEQLTSTVGSIDQTVS